MAGHHGHAAIKDVSPCVAGDSQCGAIEDLIDGRAGKLKAKDTVEVTPGPVFDVATISWRKPDRQLMTTDPPCFAGGSPPLHVLHCVYLN